MFEFRVESKKFILKCTHCGYDMPLENMKIIASSYQLLGPTVEITCTNCGKADYLISHMDI